MEPQFGSRSRIVVSTKPNTETPTPPQEPVQEVTPQAAPEEAPVGVDMGGIERVVRGLLTEFFAGNQQSPLATSSVRSSDLDPAVSPDPDRQFSQSGVPMDQRIFEPEAVTTSDESINDAVAEAMATPEPEPEVVPTAEPVAESVSRNPLTSTQQTAIASKGTSTWERTLGQPIFTNGSFSQPSLKKAIKGAGIEDEESAILRGSFETEVGDRGPITETGYSRGNVQDMGPNSVWGQRMVRDGIMTPDGDVTNLYSGDNVFNSVYANRNGNGDFASGDGSLFKGRGLIQITGRTNYQEVQNRLDQIGVNVDVMDNPSLVNDERYALPAALAMLDYLGVNSDTVPTMSAKSLNNSINSRAPVATAEERWENVISTLEAEGKQDLADSVSNRNEYSAQREIGTTVDGDVGPNTIREIGRWARSNGLNLPEGASNLDLVVFVNENS